MKNALILHGTSATPDSNWFPWLASQLKDKRYKTWIPDLPDAGFPNIQTYNKYIFSKWNFDNESILIGHSSGATAILGILQALPQDVIVDKAILVGGFGTPLGPGWENLHGLFEEPFDYPLIKQRCKHFVFIHSDNDPYVPLEKAQFLQQQLGGELVIIPGQKHFSIGTGGPQYDQFPQLLTYL